MQNLSERTGTFSSALLASQDSINTCTTASQIMSIVQEILCTDSSLKKSAVEYGKRILAKLSRVRDVKTAWQIVYNVILAGDNCGCFWSPAAESRKYR